MLRAFLSPGCNRLCVSSINVFSLEQTSLGANETGSSVKQSCIDICSDGATLPSSSGYFQKYMVFSFNKHHLLHQFPKPFTSINAVRKPRSSTLLSEYTFNFISNPSSSGDRGGTF